MQPIDPQRLEHYRQLADRGLWDIHEEAFQAFYARALAENVELVSNNFNTLGMFRAPHRKNLADLDIALVGIPLDIGVPNPRPGTRLAPREVRYWSLDRNMVHYFTKIVPFDLCRIADWGDIEFSGYSLDDCLGQIADLYSDMAQHHVTPLSIGGEHTSSYGILNGLTGYGQRPVALIQLDAHGDTSCGFQGARISDASLLQCATVDGFIDPELTVQIGLRGRGLPRNDFSHDVGMRVMVVEEVQARGIADIVAETRAIIGDHPVYLTIDTDVFDCSVMPGTTLPEPFGLLGHEVRDIIRGLRGLNLVGADLVELSPPYDPTGMSACLAAGIAFELLCLLAEAKAAQNGEKRPSSWLADE